EDWLIWRKRSDRNCHGCVCEMVDFEPVMDQGKRKRSSELAFAAPGLYPPPGTCQCLLVERQKSLATGNSGNRRARGIVTDHCVLKRAKAADTGLVDRDRVTFSVIGNRRRTGNLRCVELVAALCRGGRRSQYVIDQAGRRRAGSAR